MHLISTVELIDGHRFEKGEHLLRREPGDVKEGSSCQR